MICRRLFYSTSSSLLSMLLLASWLSTSTSLEVLLVLVLVIPSPPVPVVAINALHKINPPPIISINVVFSLNKNTANIVANTGSELNITFASLGLTLFCAFCCNTYYVFIIVYYIIVTYIHIYIIIKKKKKETTTDVSVVFSGQT
jgi:hypothetical protein